MKNKSTQCPLMQIIQAQTIDSIEQQPNITGPLRKRRQWVLRRKRRKESPNNINQFKIGSEEGILWSLTNMCSSTDMEKKYALFTFQLGILSIRQGQERVLKTGSGDASHLLRLFSPMLCAVCKRLSHKGRKMVIPPSHKLLRT